MRKNLLETFQKNMSSIKISYLTKLTCMIAMLIICACSNSDDDNEAQYLRINNSTIEIGSTGGTTVKQIESNTSWAFSWSGSYDWVMISSQTSGHGNGTLEFYVSPNTSSSTRYAYGRVSTSFTDYFVTIIQSGSGGSSTSLTAPTGVSSTISGSQVLISWNAVNGATKYNVYRSSVPNGSYLLLATVTGTSATDNSPLNGYNYYKITATNGQNESDFSSYTYVSVSNSGGNTQKPSAPTGVTVSNEGSSAIPDVRIRWNAVDNATNYYVYKSTSAYGTYSKIGEIAYTAYYDANAPTNGGTAYYKVKAVNSSGESDFSSYAKYTAEKNDDAFAPAYTYGNCTVSGNTMTLRWTNSSGNGYGKATEIVLRVWNPYAEEWQDTNLSATATSASFNFSTKIDSYGYVKAGIVVSNAKGSFTAGAKVYDTKSKKWLY